MTHPSLYLSLYVPAYRLSKHPHSQSRAPGGFSFSSHCRIYPPSKISSRREDPPKMKTCIHPEPETRNRMKPKHSLVGIWSMGTSQNDAAECAGPHIEHLYGSFPKIRGPQYRPQYNIILNPQSGTPNFGKLPPYQALNPTPTLGARFVEVLSRELQRTNALATLTGTPCTLRVIRPILLVSPKVTHIERTTPPPPPPPTHTPRKQVKYDMGELKDLIKGI